MKSAEPPDKVPAPAPDRSPELASIMNLINAGAEVTIREERYAARAVIGEMIASGRAGDDPRGFIRKHVRLILTSEPSTRGDRGLSSPVPDEWLTELLAAPPAG